MNKDLNNMPGGGGDRSHQNSFAMLGIFGGVCDASNQSLKKFALARLLKLRKSNCAQILTGRIKAINAFTLAEVLITLAIIGIVSALVIPSVLKNYNDKKYNTARLKALKTFGEAGKMASINDEMNSQANATDFVNNVLSKYLKISKVCDNNHPTDCGFPSEIQPSNPAITPKLRVIDLQKWNQIGNHNLTCIGTPVNRADMSVIVTTADRFGALIYYNPKCARTFLQASRERNCTYKECPVNNVDVACMNVIYDMNGIKGPNHIGEDMGIVTVFWSGIRAIAVAPGIIPYSANTTGTTSATFSDAPSACAGKGTNKNPYTMPSIDEISSLFINQNLVSLPELDILSGTPVRDRPGIVWFAGKNNGDRYHIASSIRMPIWCVRR